MSLRQGLHRLGIAAPAVALPAGEQQEKGLGVQRQRPGPIPLEAALHGQPLPVQEGLPVLRQGRQPVRPEGFQQGVVHPQPSPAQLLRPGRQSIEAGVEAPVVPHPQPLPALRQGGGIRRVQLPGDVQPGKEGPQDLLGRLGLPLLHLGEVGHRADAPADALLAPVPPQPLPPDQKPRDVHASPPFSILNYFSVTTVTPLSPSP